MTKYIVSAYIGFDNFGDEAIARVLTNELKAKNAESITLISSNPSKTAELHGVESCGMLNFLPSLIKADALISGGGSLLQDKTSLKSLLYYLGVIYTALIFGKKVEIYAQGIGPINSFCGKLLTKIAFKFVSKITVRDLKSQELLKTWGIDSELVKDPVLSMEIPQKNKKGIVGVQLRSFNGVDDKFLNSLAEEVAKQFLDKKIEVISLQDSIDLNVCEKFVNILKAKRLDNVKLLKELSINDVIEKISSFEYLIAMRFHASIVGIKAGVKTLVINYDPKVEKLAKEYNLPMIELDNTNFSGEFDQLQL